MVSLHFWLFWTSSVRRLPSSDLNCSELFLVLRTSPPASPWLISQSQSHIAIDGQSWPDIYYSLTVMVLLLLGVLSDERTGLSFAYAAVPRQRSLSRVRVPWDSWTYFTLKFETSHFVASHDSQGHGGDIRPRLHTGVFLRSKVIPSVSVLLTVLCRLKREHPVNSSISCFPMQLPLAYSLPRNPTVKASISLVTTYYVRASDAAVISIFVSAETETSSNSVIIEVCILILHVA
jgi:hypothetical protein